MQRGLARRKDVYMQIRGLARSFVSRAACSRWRLALAAVVGLAICAGTASAAAAQQFAALNAHVLDTYSDGYSQLRLEYAAILLQNVPAGDPKVVRVDLRWNQLEPNGQGRWSSGYVSEIDNVVNWANGYAIKTLVTVLGTPCWASSAPSNVKLGCTNTSNGDGYPPRRDNYYAQAMQYLAQRYGTKVAGWELWNEPNLSYFWNSSK